MDRKTGHLKSFLFNGMRTLLQLVEIERVRGTLLGGNVRIGEIVSMIFGRPRRMGGDNLRLGIRKIPRRGLTGRSGLARKKSANGRAGAWSEAKRERRACVIAIHSS
jgi:hypothetical protein